MIKKYLVIIPIVGCAEIEVEAEDEDAAIDDAIDIITEDDIIWEPMKILVEGNIRHFYTNEASAKEV